MCVPDQHRSAQDRHGDGGFRGQRAADLHLSGSTAGIRPHRLRGGILGAGPGGGGGAHPVLLPPAGCGRTVGHQHQDEQQPGRLLSRPLVHLPLAGVDEPADGPGVRDAGVLRHPVYHGAGPTFGRVTIPWGAGREYPVRGEDWAYLIWRKKACCAF